MSRTWPSPGLRQSSLQRKITATEEDREAMLSYFAGCSLIRDYKIGPLVGVEKDVQTEALTLGIGKIVDKIEREKKIN
ncbi:MAG: hypothetical protein V1784_08570 [bacterium]